MADSPDSILLVRLQETGGNVNLWGGYLNTALSTMTRGQRGYQALAVTGDATISWTNYSASNDMAVAFLKLTGSLTSAATLTGPNYHQDLNVWNAAGAAVTIKVSGQTGVTIPNGAIAHIRCDGTDYEHAGPTWLDGATASLTNSGDIVTKVAMDYAIAQSFTTAAGAGGTLRITSSDTTPGYGNAKVTATAPVSSSVSNAGANETLVIAVAQMALIDGGRKTASFSASSGYRYQCAWASNGTITLPASPAQGDAIVIAVLYNSSGYTTTIDPNGKKINGSTSTLNLSIVNETFILTYDATLGDWS